MEYEVVLVDELATEAIIDLLNRLAEEGWRVICAIGDGRIILGKQREGFVLA